MAELTAMLPVSQSAVSQHLKVLKDAGLVVDRADGRRRIYRVDLAGMTAVRAYVDQFWDDVLGAFAAYADPAEPPPTPANPRRRNPQP